MDMITQITGTFRASIGFDPTIDNDAMQTATVAKAGDYWDHLCDEAYDTWILANDTISADLFLTIGTGGGVQPTSVTVGGLRGGGILTSQLSTSADVTTAQWLAATTAEGLAGLITGTSNWPACEAGLKAGTIPQMATYNNVAGDSLTYAHLPSAIQMDALGVLYDVTGNIYPSETPGFVDSALTGPLEVSLNMDVDETLYSGAIGDAFYLIMTKVICKCGEVGSSFILSHALYVDPVISPPNPC